jgi:C4-dicarboxylate transporter
MAYEAEGAAGRQEPTPIPKKTIQGVLSALETPLETVVLVRNLIKAIGAVVSGADDAPVSNFSSEIMAKPWSLT